MTWNDCLLRLRALVRRPQVERELLEELDFHLAMQARKLQAAGSDRREAARRSLIQFGGLTQVQEECRDERGLGWLESAWQDIRYAIRGFRRAPVFVVTVVATIALGLGLNTALFTIFNATYFRTLPILDARSWYEATWVDRTGADHQFSWPEYRQFLTNNPAFSTALGYQFTEARLDGRTLTGTMVTGEYFNLLGIGTILGRTLIPEDSAAPGREPVIVLSYTAWKNRFAGDPGIIGRKVILRGLPFQIAGVARAGFHGLASRPTDFWAPITMAGRLDSGPALFGPANPRSLAIVGHLRPGFSVDQARLGISLWASRFTANEASEGTGVRALLTSRASPKPLSLKNVLIFSPIAMAFGLVLLIASANVANLMLARALSRQREIGIRLSLGAGRPRLIRQLLSESLLLAVPAGVAGFVVSQATIALSLRVLLATLPPGIADFATRIPRLSPDLRVFAFSLAAALLSAFCFGLVPALQGTRTDVMQAVRGDFIGDNSPTRLRSLLVVGQVTVCVLLLITAGVLLRGDSGIQSLNQALSARESIEMVIREKSRPVVLDRLAAEPGVERLAAASVAPVSRKPYTLAKPANGGETLQTATNRVSPEYFPLFEIPILRGRNFTTEESASAAAVAVISQSAAQRLWPNQDAIGQSLRLVAAPHDSLESHFPPLTVIGIARDELSRWITSGEAPDQVYLPSHPRAAGMELFVQVRGDQESARRKVEQSLTAADPNALEEIRRLQIRQWVEEDAFTFRVASWISSVLGILALALTLSGIYGVLSYLVSQRTKEIGIRMALGATPRAVTSMVLRQSLRLGTMGSVFGGILALGVSKVLASVLVMVNTFFAVAYIGGILVVLAACATAAALPCYRAARIDPTNTLRYD